VSTAAASTGCLAVTANRPDWALTWTSVISGSCETAVRTDASHPPQLIPLTINSLVCILVLLSNNLASVLYTPIGYISMGGLFRFLVFQDDQKGHASAREAIAPTEA